MFVPYFLRVSENMFIYINPYVSHLLFVSEIQL